MLTQEELSSNESDYEEEVEKSIELFVDNNQEDPHNCLEPPTPLLEKQAQKNLTHTPEDTDKDTGPLLKNRRIPLGLSWRVAVCLVLVALFVAAFLSFSKVPCKVPFIHGYQSRCVGKLDLPRSVVTPDFIRLAWVQSQLESVMEDSASTSTVAVDMKDLEMEIRDLGTRVMHSSLASKDALGRGLKLFVHEAKAASGRLQEFGNHVWGVVDRIVSENGHVLTMLGTKPLEKTEEFSSSVTNSLMLVEHEIPAIARVRSEDLWLEGVELLNRSLRKLIHKAQSNVDSLQDLGVRLNTIQGMIVAEGHKHREEEQTLIWRLWRRWFKDERKLLAHSVTLLQKVQDDHQRALSHMIRVLLVVEQMSNDLANLKKGTVTPTIIAGSYGIPIESHITSIQGVTERLAYGQARMREIEDSYRREKFISS
ncbi:unnamed protein product [Rhizoctonia solani]|uniref:Uncharacterized protein n=1 Tax=Rhizoctonia solani TaxID=456999 RepID=A0A8H2XM08_9AGAM|nr:unnamed protein product [Rhizoctonia solani]